MLRSMLLAGLIALAMPAIVCACPFCPKVSLTFSEQINSAKAVVIARLTTKSPPPQPKEFSGDAIGEALEKAKSTFQIVRVLKGQELVGDAKTVRVLYIGKAKEGATMLVFGVEAEGFVWQSALEIGAEGPEYLDQVRKLSKKGGQRLVFFQDYLTHKNRALAEDAFGEFASAPYKDLLEMKGRLKRDQIVRWIADPKTPVSRRRLYFTMLGVCGTKKEADWLAEIIRSGDTPSKRGLDALIACYLRLSGKSGLPLIEERFLKHEKIDGKQVPYIETYAAIQAIRFHGQETDVIARKRLLASLRLLLDRPLQADLVIPDLARWKDWSVIERLTTMFKQADDETSYLRVPVVQYLMACPLPAAKKKLAELEKLDPEVVRRAVITLAPAKAAKTSDSPNTAPR